MPLASPAANRPARSPAWKWWVCGLLLMATMINYMDRLTLNQMSGRIIDELSLSKEDYGGIEQAFSWAFACGALIVGWSADRWNVRLIFPLAVFLWSVAGFVTGFAQTLAGLVVCRLFLGLFEAGNWPCALRTTQRILPADERTMGNGILQSGASIGAIITPLVVVALVSGPGTWRHPFFVIGAIGSLWVVLWLATVRREDLALPPAESAVFTPPVVSAADKEKWPLLHVVRDRRFAGLLVIVITINLTWHFFRVWLPLFLRERGYDETHANFFMSAYYGATDAGALAAGFGTLYLARWGVSVHRSRVLVFLVCALLVTCSVAAGRLERGPLLLGLLLVVAFGSLGLFPVYYSLSQDLTFRHQGKLTGLLGFSTWVATGAMQPLVGRWVDRTQDYATAVQLAGLVPLIGFAALVLFWQTAETPRPAGADACRIGSDTPDGVAAEIVPEKV